MASFEIAENNRKFMNENGRAMFLQDWAVKIVEQNKELISSQIDWLSIRKRSDTGPPVKMLDYACGDGVMGRILLTHVDKIRGVDVSEGMVDYFNELARKDGISPENVAATAGDIMSMEPGHSLEGRDFFEFDFILLSMALHHVSDPQAVLTKLVERLRSGGVIAVVDFASDSVDDEAGKMMASAKIEIQKTVTRHGFSAEEMSGTLVAAGCEECSFGFVKNKQATHIPEPVTNVKGGIDRTVFIAKAQKL